MTVAGSMSNDGGVSRPISIAIVALMAATAVTLALASLTHLGNTIPLGVVTLHDPFQGAAIPEAVIAVVMVVGILGVLRGRRPAWPVALATTGFTLAVVILGLAIVLRSSVQRTGDVVYHVSLLTVLVVTLGLLLTSAGRLAFRRRGAG
jgi:hypothetical protein